MPRARHATPRSPRQETYRVTGHHAVDGHQPGETYQAAYSAAHKQFLIQAGHVEVTHSDAHASEDDTANDNSKEE